MRAIGIHIGLNAVDPGHYMGWTGTLTAAENDAQDMAGIARSNLFDVTLLLTREATSMRVLQLLAGGSARMVPGDVLILTMAGHGTQIPDLGGDEPDRLDEAWVLYDRMLIDDEIYSALSQFSPGVRILVVADSCHSETSVRMLPTWPLPPSNERSLPTWAAKKIISANQTLYTRALSVTPRTYRTDLRSNTLLMSACRDNQVALDGDQNGLFTRTLKSVWADGHFSGNYITLVKQIRHEMPYSQTPGLYGYGPQVTQFAAGRPFSRN